MLNPIPIASRRPAPAEHRVPPHNLEAEMGLLGAILVNNRSIERVAEFLRPEHFADPLNGRIYEAARTVIERGQIANPTTLRYVLEADPAFAEVGGAQYLARLAENAVTIINAADYARLVHDLHLRRSLIELGTDVVNDAYGADLDHLATRQIETAEQRLYDLATSGEQDGGFKPFTDSMRNAILLAQAAFQREGKLAGLATGFGALDQMLGGLHKSDLVILAGRPSMGKTALATNIAFNAARAAARDGGGIGFFSLEMSAEQLATRILAEVTRVPSNKVRNGELNQREFDSLVQKSHELQHAKLFIDDTPALSVSALRTRARRLKRQHGLSLIVIDYLQLVHGTAPNRLENRVQEISEITRGLKTLAKELDVPVLALSQLSRAVENREDKRPQLADLRESGTIEQDADVVMFIFREEYYLARREPREGTEEHETWQEAMEKVYGRAEIIIAKQRHGPIGTAVLRFEPSFTRFDNLDSDADAEAPF
ncbi:MAG: replicative DNA helicase [Alphaproteobacteria bacterium]|nr:replicative DNA helicase [Alphaproteobacteria bacterium]